MAQIASWDQMEAELFWQHRGAAISSVTNMMEKHKYLYRVTIKLQPFDAACVQNDRFSFGKQEIFCTVLERIDRSKITEGYLYAFHAPDFPVEEAFSLLSQYYLETFQIACIDVVREWVRDLSGTKAQCYVTALLFGFLWTGLLWHGAFGGGEADGCYGSGRCRY